MDTEAHTSNLGFSHGRWMLPSYRLAASVSKICDTLYSRIERSLEADRASDSDCENDGNPLREQGAEETISSHLIHPPASPAPHGTD